MTSRVERIFKGEWRVANGSFPPYSLFASHPCRIELRPLAGAVIQFVTSIYGGFFGAGMGIMMLATLGLTETGDYHKLNALKNMLSIVVAAVAIIVFASGGVVTWLAALIMVPAVALGGYFGVWSARRVPQLAVRIFVIAVGLFLTVYYFF